MKNLTTTPTRRPTSLLLTKPNQHKGVCQQATKVKLQDVATKAANIIAEDQTSTHAILTSVLRKYPSQFEDTIMFTVAANPEKIDDILSAVFKVDPSQFKAAIMFAVTKSPTKKDAIIASALQIAPDKKKEIEDAAIAGLNYYNLKTRAAVAHKCSETLQREHKGYFKERKAFQDFYQKTKASGQDIPFLTTGCWNSAIACMYNILACIPCLDPIETEDSYFSKSLVLYLDRKPVHLLGLQHHFNPQTYTMQQLNEQCDHENVRSAKLLLENFFDIVAPLAKDSYESLSEIFTKDTYKLITTLHHVFSILKDYVPTKLLYEIDPSIDEGNRDIHSSQLNLFFNSIDKSANNPFDRSSTVDEIFQKLDVNLNNRTTMKKFLIALTSPILHREEHVTIYSNLCKKMHSSKYNSFELRPDKEPLIWDLFRNKTLEATSSEDQIETVLEGPITTSALETIKRHTARFISEENRLYYPQTIKKRPYLTPQDAAVLFSPAKSQHPLSKPTLAESDSSITSTATTLANKKWATWSHSTEDICIIMAPVIDSTETETAISNHEFIKTVAEIRKEISEAAKRATQIKEEDEEEEEDESKAAPSATPTIRIIGEPNSIEVIITKLFTESPIPKANPSLNIEFFFTWPQGSLADHTCLNFIKKGFSGHIHITMGPVSEDFYNSYNKDATTKKPNLTLFYDKTTNMPPSYIDSLTSTRTPQSSFTKSAVRLRQPKLF